MSFTDWLWAIPVFGLLIFIHELGHFAVAKWFDVRVHEFALGFGPVVAGFERGETRYNLRLVPLGGFVRMAGMDESEGEDPRGFNRKSILARSLTIFAGPFMNFVLASLLLSGYIYSQGVPNPAPILGDVLAQCQVVAGGQAKAVPCPAAAAGLQAGDRVLTINGLPTGSWSDILAAVKGSEGKPLHIAVERGQEVKELTVQPVYQEGRYMVGILQSSQRGSAWTAIRQGPVVTAAYFKATVVGLFEAVTGKSEVQLSGPVGITREIASQASAGLTNLLWLTAFLSINLGFFNLLPIPALDGSRLVFMLVELIRGRKVDPQRENMVHAIGFLIMIGLIVVVTYGDIVGRR